MGNQSNCTKWSGGDVEPIYPELIEQGIAKYYGDYRDIMNGGNVLQCMELLLGSGSAKMQLCRKVTWEHIRVSLEKGSIVVLGIPNKHDYAVTRCFEREGRKYLELSDPNNSSPHAMRTDPKFKSFLLGWQPSTGISTGDRAGPGRIDVEFRTLQTGENKFYIRSVDKVLSG